VIFGREIIGAVVKEVRASRVIIQVAMFEWSWYAGQHTGTVQDINRELCIRSKAGVEVNVVLHRESMGRMLHRINVKTERHLRDSGVKVRLGWAGNPVHCKVWIFDRRVVIVGSHNISNRSAKVNYEASVLFDDRVEVERAVEWYDALWGRARG